MTELTRRHGKHPDNPSLPPPPGAQCEVGLCGPANGTRNPASALLPQQHVHHDRRDGDPYFYGYILVAACDNCAKEWWGP